LFVLLLITQSRRTFLVRRCFKIHLVNSALRLRSIVTLQRSPIVTALQLSQRFCPSWKITTGQALPSWLAQNSSHRSRNSLPFGSPHLTTTAFTLRHHARLPSFNYIRRRLETRPPIPSPHFQVGPPSQRLLPCEQRHLPVYRPYSRRGFPKQHGGKVGLYRLGCRQNSRFASRLSSDDVTYPLQSRWKELQGV
jgi:hypothetical protein